MGFSKKEAEKLLVARASGRRGRAGLLLLMGLLGAAVFVAGVATNLIATYVEKSLEPYRAWVWIAGGLGLAATIAAAVIGLLPQKQKEKDQANRAAPTNDLSGGIAEDYRLSGLDADGDIVMGDKVTHIHRPLAESSELSKGPTFPIHSIGHARNPDFTGRVGLLGELEKALGSGKATAVTQAVAGLGGVGKTQSATEYCYRHAMDYDVVWWVRSEESATLAGDYAALAQRLDLPEKNLQDQRQIVAAVRRWLEGHGRWLLVFDDAADKKGVKDYIPHGVSGHVIVTSRKSDWSGVASTLRVEVFERKESVDFILSRTRQEDRGAADRLAEALGDFPLALAQAAGYMEQTGKSVDDYLRLLGERAGELLERGTGTPDYEKTVSTTWLMAVEEAGKKQEAAPGLLNLCAFFAPEDIPLEMVRKGAEFLPEPLKRAAEDELKLDDAVAALRDYSLVECAGGKLSVHRLVQMVAREKLPEEEKKRWAEAAVLAVNRVFPYKEDDPATWAPSGLLWPHVSAGADYAEELGAGLDAVGRLLNQGGLYLSQVAQFDEAKAVLERAVEIGEKVYGPEHPGVAAVANNLGLVLRAQGDLGAARKAHERALAIAEKVYGPAHPGVGTMVNNLGSVLLEQGNLHGASKAFERALAIDEEVYGPEHPSVAIRLNNLGSVLRRQGDLEEAGKAFERALAIDEKVYGPGHPMVATVVNNLGLVLARSDVEGAREAFERALAIDEKVYGPEHPTMAIRVNNLGLVLWKQNDLAGARKAFERALRMLKTSLPEDHPRITVTRENLAGVEAEMRKRDGESSSA